MHTILLLLCVVVAFAGEVKGAPQSIDWSTQPAGKSGDLHDKLRNPTTGSEIISYRVIAPAPLPERRTLGLIVAFHGLPGTVDFMTGFVQQGLQGAGLEAGYVVVGGKSIGEGWAAADESNLMNLINWVMATYPIDRRRVFFWGASNGGFMTGYMASRHAEILAGAAPACGYGLRDPPTAKDPATTMLEYYWAHGDADEACNVRASRVMSNRLFELGYRGVYREIDGGDHAVTVLDKPLLIDTARWIDLLRSKQIAPTDAETKWLKSVSNEMLAKPETWTELVRIGGGPGWMVAAKAQRSTDATVRLALATACSSVFFAGEETVAALTKLADDKDEAVRLAAIAALAMHADRHTASAQIALGKLAVNRRNPDAVRTAAAKGLAVSLTMILRGNFSDDPDLFDAVNAMLDSDSAEVRAAIAAPLLAAVKPFAAYEPAGDAAARKAPVAAWKAWLEAQRGTDGEKDVKPKDKPKKK